MLRGAEPRARPRTPGSAAYLIFAISIALLDTTFAGSGGYPIGSPSDCPAELIAQVMKALTDPTPGLRSILPRVLRDEEIRRLAQTMSASGAAARIASELRRYLSAGWTIDREQGAPVDASELRRSLFRIATFNAGADLTERQIRTIIAA